MKSFKNKLRACKSLILQAFLFLYLPQIAPILSKNQ